jgi:hypothetical protein
MGDEQDQLTLGDGRYIGAGSVSSRKHNYKRGSIPQILEAVEIGRYARTAANF